MLRYRSVFFDDLWCFFRCAMLDDVVWRFVMLYDALCTLKIAERSVRRPWGRYIWSLPYNLPPLSSNWSLINYVVMILISNKWMRCYLQVPQVTRFASAAAFCFGPWLWFGDDRSMSEFMTMGSLDVGHLIFFIPTAPSCHKNSICVFMFGPASWNIVQQTAAIFCRWSRLLSLQIRYILLNPFPTLAKTDCDT